MDLHNVIDATVDESKLILHVFGDSIDNILNNSNIEAEFNYDIGKWVIPVDNIIRAKKILSDSGYRIIGGFEHQAIMQGDNTVQYKETEIKLADNGKEIEISADINEIKKIRNIINGRYDRLKQSLFIPLYSIKSIRDILVKQNQDVSKYDEFIRNNHLDNKRKCEKAISYINNKLSKDGHNLYDHQAIGIANLVSHNGFYLADDMGLGKTLQTIAAAEFKGGKKLVVCPSIAKNVWHNEIKKWIGNKSISIINGKCNDFDSEWVIINYDILERWHDKILKSNFDILIVDEAHFIKNKPARRTTDGWSGGTIRTALTMELSNKIPICYLLSGTAITNNPIDLWNSLIMIRHPLSIGPRAKSKFISEYCGKNSIDKLFDDLGSQFLRRLKDDCLDLPGKQRTFEMVSVDLDTYNKKLNDYVQKKLKEGKSEREIKLGYLSKERVLASEAKNSAIEEAVDEVLRTGSKVIVFASFNNTLDHLEQKYGDKLVRVDGSTTHTMKDHAEDRFQNDESCRIFAANLISAGTALTLTKAKYIIMGDLDWVPSNHSQAEDRAYRIGQTNKVQVRYLIAKDTIEERVFDIFEKKQGIINALDNKASEAYHISLDELLDDRLERILENIYL